MTRLRVPILVLAVLQMVLAGFTALVGAFADGGDVVSRLLLVVVHPLAAVGMLLMLSLPRPATSLVIAAAALLTVNVVADLMVALMIAVGAVSQGRLVALADILRDSGGRACLCPKPAAGPHGQGNGRMRLSWYRPLPAL